MSYHEERLQEIADAIRTKKGTTESIPATNFADEILSLQSGGKYNIEQIIDEDECELYITDSEDSKLYLCEAIDYDGTVLKREMLPAGAEFVLPEFPQHERLTAQEWSGTVQVSNGKVTVPEKDIIFGVVYTTKSGSTEFDVKLNAITGKKVFLNLSGQKDWGDGSSDSLTYHTYADYGEYTIKWDGSLLDSGEDLKSLFAEYSDEDSICCVNVHIGSNVTEINRAFIFIPTLKTITIPKSVSQISSESFYTLDVLHYITFSSSLTTISFGSEYAKRIVIPYNCTKLSVSSGSLTKINLPNTIIELSVTSNQLKEIKIPENVEKLSLSCANITEVDIPNKVKYLSFSCAKVEKLNIPDSVTQLPTISGNNLKEVVMGNSVTGSITTFSAPYITSLKLSDNITTIGFGSGFLQSLYLLKEIKMPANVNSIGTKCFNSYCYSLEKIDFSSITNIPTEKTGKFKISPHCKVVVPDAFYDTMYNSSSWADVKNNLCKASEVV